MGNTQTQCFEVYPEMHLNHTKLHLISDTLPQTLQEYLKEHVGLQFYGQSSKIKDTDYSSFRKKDNLASIMHLIDEHLRESNILQNPVAHETDDKFIHLVKLLAKFRKSGGENEEICFERLKKQSQYFLDIYRSRPEMPEKLTHLHYWGCKQQLLSGKIIGDWIDQTNGPLDPVFGSLLVPCAGRVGPDDSSFVHKLFFDNNGYMAYHAAAHDAFGYLQYFHDIGPGYDYMHYRILDKKNMFAGQITGILFWRDILHEFKQEEFKLKSI